jgi:hypothetical protein
LKAETNWISIFGEKNFKRIGGLLDTTTTVAAAARLINWVRLLKFHADELFQIVRFVALSVEFEAKATIRSFGNF